MHVSEGIQHIENIPLTIQCGLQIFLNRLPKKDAAYVKGLGACLQFSRNAWIVRAERKMTRKFPLLNSSLTMERSAEMPSQGLPYAKGTLKAER